MAEDKICEKKPDLKCILEGIIHGKNIIRGGKYIVKHMGEAVYVDVFRVTLEELEKIIKFLAGLKRKK
jgi:hypothetical protein